MLSFFNINFIKFRSLNGFNDSTEPFLNQVPEMVPSMERFHLEDWIIHTIQRLFFQTTS